MLLRPPERIWRSGSVAALALALSCGGPRAPDPAPSPAVSSGASAADDELGIPDENDRCSWLPRECLDGFDYADEDGCPDPPPPELRFAPGSATIDDDATRVIGEVSLDGARLAAGAVIALATAPSELARARVDVVRGALLEAGVSADRVDETPAALPPREPPWPPDVVVVVVRGCAF